MIIPNRSLIISNYTKLSYTMMSLLFRRKRLVFSDNNFQKFPKIGSNNNYWIKLSSIIGNYCPRKMRLAASYKLFLFTYLFMNIGFVELKVRKCFSTTDCTDYTDF